MKLSLRRLFFSLLIVLFVVVAFVAAFFISRNVGPRVGVSACDSHFVRVKEQPFTISVHLAAYKDIPSAAYRDEHLPMLPVWFVKVSALWVISGGPQTDSPSDDVPSIVVAGDCTAVINALNGEVLLTFGIPSIE